MQAYIFTHYIIKYYFQNFIACFGIISFGFMLSMKISVMFFILQKNSALAVGLGTAQ